HRTRCDGEEMRAIHPLHAALVDEAHVRLVDERRRRQRFARAVPAQAVAGRPLQLAVREREQLVVGLSVTCAGAVQEGGRVAWGLHTATVYGSVRRAMALSLPGLRWKGRGPRRKRSPARGVRRSIARWLPAWQSPESRVAAE